MFLASIWVSSCHSNSMFRFIPAGLYLLHSNRVVYAQVCWQLLHQGFGAILWTAYIAYIVNCSFSGNGKYWLIFLDVKMSLYLLFSTSPNLALASDVNVKPFHNASFNWSCMMLLSRQTTIPHAASSNKIFHTQIHNWMMRPLPKPVRKTGNKLHPCTSISKWLPFAWGVIHMTYLSQTKSTFSSAASKLSKPAIFSPNHKFSHLRSGWKGWKEKVP